MLFVISCLCIPKLYQQVARPFAPWRNVSSFSIENCPVLTQSEEVMLCEILSQRFYYLGKGVQAFAFVSEDGMYVVKIPYFDRYHHSFLRKVKNWLKLPVKPKQTAQKVLGSYKIAWDHLKEEAELIWCHLKPGKSALPAFQVRDRRGIWHTIDPRIHTFAIQKKATPFFQELKQAHSPEKFRQLVESYVDLLTNLDAKGCYNTDRKGKSNFGVYEGKVIQIDIGSFELSSKQQKSFFVAKLKGWMEKHAPDKIEKS